MMLYILHLAFVLLCFGYKGEPLPPKIELQPLPKWDYIVIGAGATGIPIAYQLAQKHSVLLLERGPERIDHQDTWTFEGVGRNLAAPGEGPTTLIRTSSGVVSHIGNVVGGGTGVNMGYLLSEKAEYWKWYRDHYGFHLDVDQFMDSHKFILSHIGFSVSDLAPYSSAYKHMLKTRYAPYSDVSTTDILEGGGTFRGRSLFNDQNQGQRVLLDSLLSREKIPPGLDVRANTGVTRIHFIAKPVKKAVCVSAIKKKTRRDAWKLGNRGIFNLCDVPLFQHVPFLCKTVFPSYDDDGLVYGLEGSPISASSLNNKLLGIHPPLPIDRDSYCLHGVIDEVLKQATNDGDLTTNGGIILSAGPIFTPLLLQNSGIGPRRDVPYRSIVEGDRNVMEQIGRHMNDRLMTFMSYFSRGVKDIRIGTGLGIVFEGECNDDSRPNGTDEDGKCVPYVVEDLGGQGLALSTVLATKAIFPMTMRDDSMIMLFTQLIEICMALNEDLPRIPYISDSPLLLEFMKLFVCPFTGTTIQCFKEGRGIFTMQSQPQSRGYVSLKDQVEDSSTMFVHMPYLEKEVDRDLIVKTIRRLLESIDDNDSFEGGGRASDSLCPFPIVNMSLSFFAGTWIPAPIMRMLSHLILGEDKHKKVETSNFWDMVTAASPFVHGMESSTTSIISIEDAMKMNFKSRLLTTDETLEILSAMETSSKKLELLEGAWTGHSVDGTVPIRGIDALSKWKSTNLSGDGYHSDKVQGHGATEEDEVREEDMAHSVDFNKAQMKAIIDDEHPQSETGTLWVNKHSLSGFVPWLSSAYVTALKSRIERGSTFLLFPGVPDLDDDHALLEYAINYSISLWHWNGSMMRSATGPVDSDFTIKGIVDNMFIGDSSILPSLPRMNPQLSMMALGHYIGSVLSKESCDNNDGLCDSGL